MATARNSKKVLASLDISLLIQANSICQIIHLQVPKDRAVHIMKKVIATEAWTCRDHKQVVGSDLYI